MSIVAAQSFVAAQLHGMVPPGDTGLRAPITALITPLDPDVNPDGIARCYVWPASGPEKRLAMPRNNAAQNNPGGAKQTTHEIQVFMVWMDDPNDQNADVNFPLLIQYVLKVLRTCPSPSLITDPYTGEESQMVNLGEVQAYDFVPPRTLEPQVMRRYDARIRATLVEIFQA